MKFMHTFLVPCLLGITTAASIEGFDISNYQPNVDFKKAYTDGLRFVMIKATEGTSLKDASFSKHYKGATDAGFIRGGYHFARPASSSGAAQADFFYKNGGGWSKDGITLPGMLDLEVSDCGGLSHTGMVNWIQEFVNEYHRLSSRYPILYFSSSWWEQCAGNSRAFKDTCPRDLASWNTNVCPIPGGWPFETFWQYKDSNTHGGDSVRFNGGMTQLKKLATG